MIIVKLTGGLGNQLYQYAQAKFFAIEKKTELKLDISWYKGRISRKFLLNNFNIDAKIANFFDIVWVKIFNKNNYIESDKRNDWQSTVFVDKIATIIKKEFSLKTPLSEKNKETSKNILSSNSVSIHIRGGDYVTGNKSGFHGTCTAEYYAEAIQYIKNRNESLHFYIFTDDIAWANKLMKFPEACTVVSDDKNEPYEELILMSQCKHNITANSTFSFWAAWLNRNEDKIVITPKKWFNDTTINIDEFLPKSWIKM